LLGGAGQLTGNALPFPKPKADEAEVDEATKARQIALMQSAFDARMRELQQQRDTDGDDAA
jgi:hypothetical protein